MVITPGASYEHKLIGEAVLLFMTGGLPALAVACYDASCKEKRNKRDNFFAGLAYSEFLSEDNTDTNLYAASVYRDYLCKRIGLLGFDIFKAVENIYCPGRYPLKS